MNYFWRFLGYNKQSNDCLIDVQNTMPKQPNLIRRNSKRFVIGDESLEDSKNNEKKSEQPEWNQNARFLTVGTTLT